MSDDPDTSACDDLIRAAGLCLTRQRQTIMRILIEAGDHPDAGQGLSRARQNDTSISQATTYRTLADARMSLSASKAFKKPVCPRAKVTGNTVVTHDAMMTVLCRFGCREGLPDVLPHPPMRAGSNLLWRPGLRPKRA